MQITNSTKFEEVVNAIFARLLGTFPVPLDLAASDIGIVPAPEPEPRTIGGLAELTEREPNFDEEFFDHCVTWLYAEEYLRGAKKSFGSFGGVTLTQKALLHLKATPPCLSSHYYN